MKNKNEQKLYGERIMALRKAFGKQQDELAAVLGISEVCYRKYERGRRKLMTSQAVTPARYYGVSLDYIAGLIDDPQKINI